VAALSDIVKLAADQTFGSRVRAAVAEQAFAVLDQDPRAVEGGPWRATLARQSLDDLAGMATKFVIAVAIHDPVVAAFAANGSQAAVTDAMIRDRVASAWNYLSGYAAVTQEA